MSFHGQERGGLESQKVMGEIVVELAVVITPTPPGPPVAGTVITADGHSQVAAVEVIVNPCQLFEDKITSSEGTSIKGIGRGDGHQALRKIASRDPSSGGSFGIDRVGQGSLFNGHEGRNIPIVVPLYSRAHLI